MTKQSKNILNKQYVYKSNFVNILNEPFKHVKQIVNEHRKYYRNNSNAHDQDKHVVDDMHCDGKGDDLRN